MSLSSLGGGARSLKTSNYEDDDFDADFDNDFDAPSPEFKVYITA